MSRPYGLAGGIVLLSIAFVAVARAQPVDDMASPRPPEVPSVMAEPPGPEADPESPERGTPRLATPDPDAPPVDVAGWTSDDARLPAPPSGFTEVRRGAVRWVYPAQAETSVEGLMRTYATAWDRITGELGADVDPELVLRVGRNPDEMAALAPIGRPPPAYASGVAYPSLGVVLLSLTAPGTWHVPPLDRLLAHELSHIALRRAVGGRPLPRWFVEGVAIHQAREYDLPRMRTFWEGAASERLLPLDVLSERFPNRPHEVNLAYAQSADFVAFLMRADEDGRRFRRTLAEVRAGTRFEDAVRLGYGASLGALEADWREHLADHDNPYPVLFGGGVVWVMASLLVFIAWYRRRRVAKAKLERWEEEEAMLDELEVTVTKKAAEAEVSDAQRLVMLVSDDPPQGREPDVPTVSYEGREHTLH